MKQQTGVRRWALPIVVRFATIAIFSLLLWHAPADVRAQNADTGSNNTSSPPTGSEGNTSHPPPPATTGPPSTNPPAVQSQPGAPPASQQPIPKPHPWFEAHGSFFERYRDDTNHDNGGHDSRDAVTYGNITGTINVSPLYSFYARIGGEALSPRGQGRDFNTNYYTGDRGWRGALAIDQFGVIYHDAEHGLLVTVGRQDQPLDATGTAYDQSFKVGKHTFLDGIAIVKKLGSGTVEGYAFSEDQFRQISNGPNRATGRATRNGLYALRGTYNPLGAMTLGAMVARFVSSSVNQKAGIATTTNYEADISYQAVKNLLLKAEYGRSNASSRNDLYYGLVKYSITKQDSATVYTYKIGQNADIGEDSGYPNNNRGTRYFLEHDFDIHISLIVYHEVDRRLYGPGQSNSDQVTLVYTF